MYDVPFVRRAKAAIFSGCNSHPARGRSNRMLRGWANYFCQGAVGAAYSIVDQHVCFRLRQWLGSRERTQGSSRSRYSEPYLRRTYGLFKLAGRPRRPSCAKA